MNLPTAMIRTPLMLAVLLTSLPALAEESLLASIPTYRPNMPEAYSSWLGAERPSGETTLNFAAPPPPNDLGAPGQRSDGAGSRGCGTLAQAPTLSPDTPLTAIVPVYESADSTVVFGMTRAEHPTLWVYTPYGPPHTARFVLLTQAGEPIHEANVELPESPGVISLSLPATLPPLEPDEPYHWFFNIYCQSPPPLAFVEGWLQRNVLPVDVESQLTQLSLREQIQYYAANGLWHDALTTAAALHDGDSHDSSWSELIQSVGLENLVSEPIVECCQIGQLHSRQ